MEGSKGQCFVMQPFDRGRYDKLYQQVFEPAIRKAHLEPYRVDNDPAAAIPIETIQQEITNSVACFGEITEDNPNVWFELGYAIAREKPLCLVCSTTRTRFPFDVQHRKIIQYPANPLPEDYAALEKDIMERLTAAVTKDESRRQNAEVVSALSIIPETNGLAPHELLALTQIFQEQFSYGISVWSLKQEMEKGGYLKVATSLAVTRLIRKEFIEIKDTLVEDNSGNSYNQDRCFVTEEGQEWLLNNQHRLNLYLPTKDDDIPF